MSEYEWDSKARYYRLIADVERREVAAMFAPVRCTCGQIYDMGHVTVTARYADCSVWTAPCCGRVTDDRPSWTDDPNQINAGTKL